MVGGANRASPIPICLSPAGSVSEAGLDGYGPGAAEWREWFDFQLLGNDTFASATCACRRPSTMQRGWDESSRVLDMNSVCYHKNVCDSQGHCLSLIFCFFVTIQITWGEQKSCWLKSVTKWRQSEKNFGRAMTKRGVVCWSYGKLMVTQNSCQRWAHIGMSLNCYMICMRSTWLWRSPVHQLWLLHHCNNISTLFITPRSTKSYC